MLNLSTVRTPGVYIDEIPKFPPSIAPVETAIPAFIGYTRIATENSLNDLANVPKKIGSIADFELYYGTGPRVNVAEVVVNDANQFLSAKISNSFYMYDSLRLFYANGGGDCYVVSVGLYDPVDVQKAHFFTGIDNLEKFTEPTLILMPDAALLPATDLYEVQVKALNQCVKLQDRFVLCDLKETDPKGIEFRQNIGINGLNYGAAYSPWLKASLPKLVTYRDFFDPVTNISKIKRGVSVVQLGGLTDDVTTQGTITKLDEVMDDVDKIDAATKANLITDPANSSIRANFTKTVDTYRGGPTVARFQSIFTYLYKVATTVDGYLSGGTALANADLKNSIGLLISSTLRDLYKTLITYEEEAEDKVAAYAKQFPATPSSDKWRTVPANAATNIFTAAQAPSAVMSGANDIAEMNSMVPKIIEVFESILAAYNGGVINEAANAERTLNNSLSTTFPVFKSIINGISNASTNLPPSGVIAGVYSFVDRTRGVWKAPANVSLTGVREPAFTFTATELDLLNVDPVAGKSINAIRSFTGKGTLVWGARTLAGNDNEWRYINVRRLFNMVEESCKNAVEAFVFEPNDANTWVKVQAMIENFLTTLWRQGAFFGATPDKAFYVAVGLGKTMTSLDILEGRMIVEIGIAANRPAEFIILRFSHKLPE